MYVCHCIPAFEPDFAGALLHCKFRMLFQANTNGDFIEFKLVTFRFEARNHYHYTTAAWEILNLSLKPISGWHLEIASHDMLYEQLHCSILVNYRRQVLHLPLLHQAFF